MSGEIYLDGTVTPTSAAPIAKDTDLFGGFRSVANAAARNAIDTLRRVQGMRAIEQDTARVYELLPPPWVGSDLDWALVSTEASLYPIAPAPPFPAPGPLTYLLPPVSLEVPVDTSAGVVGVTIELDASCPDGVRYGIKDSKRLASTNNIIIQPMGGLQIEQFGGGLGANLVINVNGQSVTLRKDFGEWCIQ